MLRNGASPEDPNTLTQMTGEITSKRITNNSSDLKPLNQYITSDRIVIKERGGRVSGILNREE
jgi:hypothetical protein